MLRRLLLLAVCGTLLHSGTAMGYKSLTPFTLSLEGNYSLFAMSDVNTVVGANNKWASETYGGYGILGTIERGFNASVSFSVRISKHIDVVLRFGHLSASQGYQTVWLIEETHSSGWIEQELTVETYPLLMGVNYSSRIRNGPCYLILGAELGRLYSGLYQNSFTSGVGTSFRTARGRGGAFQIHAGIEREVMPIAGVFLDIGYRRAKVKELTWRDISWPVASPAAIDETVYVQDGVLYGEDAPESATKMTVDFGGLYVSAGVRVHL